MSSSHEVTFSNMIYEKEVTPKKVRQFLGKRLTSDNWESSIAKAVANYEILVAKRASILKNLIKIFGYCSYTYYEIGQRNSSEDIPDYRTEYNEIVIGEYDWQKLNLMLGLTEEIDVESVQVGGYQECVKLTVTGYPEQSWSIANRKGHFLTKLIPGTYVKKSGYADEDDFVINRTVIRPHNPDSRWIDGYWFGAYLDKDGVITTIRQTHIECQRAVDYVMSRMLKNEHAKRS